MKEIDENLLSGGDDNSPFFGGHKTITAADICYAPFLERYRYQLPCLHRGLDPTDAKQYPNLSRWYKAMDNVPAYACRVKGDAGSWRKVLTMAGFGNAGLPPNISETMEERMIKEEELEAKSCINQKIWDEFRSTACYPVPKSPYIDAATIMIRNHKAIVKDTTKRLGDYTEQEVDLSLQVLVKQLLQWHDNDDKKILVDGKNKDIVANLAAFLDERMCVPRDMGAQSAATIKKLSIALRK